jgi:hypothetical protein
LCQPFPKSLSALINAKLQRLNNLAIFPELALRKSSLSDLSETTLDLWLRMPEKKADFEEWVMADSDMLKAAEDEVQRLEAELAETPAYQKLQLAKQVVALYRGIPTLRLSSDGHPVNPAEFVKRVHEERVLTTKTARIDAAAAKYLKTKGARAPASELLEPVIKEGVMIGGKEPVKALSAYLSNSKAFNNQRELGGYGLAEWGHSRGPSL